MAVPKTRRGRATRERILLAAVRLFHEFGVGATSVDDVLGAAGAGKGQFYRYFASKEKLVAATVDHQLDRYLRPQRAALEQVERWEDLERYLHELVAAHAGRGFVGGCPVGSLALELTGHDERLRRRLAEAFEEWQASLAVALARLEARGELRADLPPERLATSLLATIQGAYLLSTARRNADVMTEAFEAALAHLRPSDSEAGTVPARSGTT